MYSAFRAARGPQLQVALRAWVVPPGRRAQPTLSALARVTVHKRPDGTFTAVDLRDGCFGTATIMRIVAMFVPHNIFEDRAPDGARISRCALRVCKSAA